MKTVQALVTLGFGSALTLATPLFEEANAGIARNQPSFTSELDRRSNNLDWDDGFGSEMSDIDDSFEDDFGLDRRDLSASKLSVREWPENEAAPPHNAKNLHLIDGDYDDNLMPEELTKPKGDVNDCNCASEHHKVTSSIQARSCPNACKNSCSCPFPRPSPPKSNSNPPKPNPPKPKPGSSKKTAARDLHTGEKQYIPNIDRPVHAHVAQPSIQGLNKKYHLHD